MWKRAGRRLFRVPDAPWFGHRDGSIHKPTQAQPSSSSSSSFSLHTRPMSQRQAYQHFRAAQAAHAQRTTEPACLLTPASSSYSHYSSPHTSTRPSNRAAAAASYSAAFASDKSSAHLASEAHHRFASIDAHAQKPPKTPIADRRELLRQSLEARALSTIEFTPGGEEAVDTQGDSAAAYHSRPGFTNVPMDSAMYSAVHARHALDSRRRTNSWSLARRTATEATRKSTDDDGREQGHGRGKNRAVGQHTTHADAVEQNRVNAFRQSSPPPTQHRGLHMPLGETAQQQRKKEEEHELHRHSILDKDRACRTNHTAPAADSAALDSLPDGEQLDASRRRRRASEGGYSHTLDGELLEPTPENVGLPRSTYSMRKMYIDGLVGYEGVITRAEEAAMSDELLHLMQDRNAAYIAEEARYCVNLYEKELGISAGITTRQDVCGSGNTLAFGLDRAPMLQRVLYRFFVLGLIPAPPNVCQVSEMTGNFSGYPVHHKPASIGPYYGILNLISTTVLHMQHRDCPWFPRLHLNPRSLFVVEEPCLSEYASGYQRTHQPFHSFEYATRVSKDYRLEVLFACVEVSHMPHLNEAVRLTDYAEARAAAAAMPRQITSSTRVSDAADASAPVGASISADADADADAASVAAAAPASATAESVHHARKDGNHTRSSDASSRTMHTAPEVSRAADGRPDRDYTGATPLRSTDAWIEAVREGMHAQEQHRRTSHGGDGPDIRYPASTPAAVDGHALRRQLQKELLVGRTHVRLDCDVEHGRSPHDTHARTPDRVRDATHSVYNDAQDRGGGGGSGSIIEDGGNNRARVLRTSRSKDSIFQLDEDDTDGVKDEGIGGERAKRSMHPPQALSASQQRMAALRTRYNFAQSLQSAVQRQRAGVHVIRGVSPADRAGKL